MQASSVAIQKKSMRVQILSRLSRLSPSVRKTRSRKITAKLMRKNVFQKAVRIFTYLALPGEVQTLDLVKESLKAGKRVFVPKIKTGKKREMHICEITDAVKDVQKGRYGILEPKTKQKRGAVKLDLIIVPGLAFDKKRNRLGRGLGYFDRFLAHTKGVPLVALAFKEQVVKKVPAERHDIAVHQLITG